MVKWPQGFIELPFSLSLPVFENDCLFCRKYKIAALISCIKDLTSGNSTIVIYFSW